MADNNLAWLRGLKLDGVPDFGSKMYDLIKTRDLAVANLAQQVNGNVSGEPQSPPQVNSLTVTANDGHFSAVISDTGNIYRGINYFIEHADNSHFINPITEPLGTSRNWHDYLGNTTRFFRAYSSYPGSPPSAPVYHGSSVQPTAVQGGGSGTPAVLAASGGSGTGGAGVGLSGFGPVPFRSSDGSPPSRS